VTAPIDATAFANLVEITGGDLAFVDELVDTYLADGATQIATIRTAAAAGDVGTLTRAAHSMKSGSLNIGALEVGALCRSLEEQGRSGAVPDADPQIAAIATAFDDARRELLAERARRTAS
jgi:HPt (histidine-containing phosphotransfer) domain-containing protein